MFRLRAVFFGPLIALGIACGPLEESGPSYVQAEQEIVGGTIANGDPAVVALAQLYQGEYYQYCTATLIAPKTLITAAHCVDNQIVPYAVFGTYVSSPTRTVQVAQQIRHPSYSNNSLNADIAVMRLATAVTGVTPIPINTTGLTSGNVGLSIRHVGFGVTSGAQQSGSGVKREVTYPIREIQTSKFESGGANKQTCQGDSGGPGFVVMPGTTSEVVAGVVSYGSQDCLQDGWDTRVDYYASWVQTTIAAWEAPTCADDGKCKAGCTPIDIDCACAADGQCTTQCTDLTRDPDCPQDCTTNGVCSTQACPWPDADCRAEGTACTSDLQCVQRECASDPQHASMYCSRPCTSNAQCTLSGMECASDGVCKWQQKPTANIGDTCTAETYCLAGGICTGDSLSDLRCQVPCNSQDLSCPGTTQTCTQGVTNAYYCKSPTSGGGGNPGTNTGSKYVVLPRAHLERQTQASGCSSSGGAPLWAGALLLSFVVLGRRRRRTAAALAVAAIAVGGCGTPLDEEPAHLDTAASEIVGGTTDYGDPEVFLLYSEYSNGSSSVCTATLIESRTLATAAHCVDATLAGPGVSLTALYATNKTSMGQAGQGDWYVAVETRKHPDWNPSVSLNDDIAMVLLDRAPPVTKKPWNQASIITFQGKTVRAVGYGITWNNPPANDSGVKRQVTLAINSVDFDHIYLGNGSNKGICHGDSGGPTFHTFPDGVERLIGIHSYDGNGECTIGADIRVDAYANFINTWLSQKEGPQCGNDGQCKSGCTPVDTDCYCLQDGVCSTQCPNLAQDPDCPADCVPNGVCATGSCPVPDVDCVAEGDSCSSELQCRNRVCISDAQHPEFYCSRACGSSAECPTDMECNGSVCQYKQLPERSFGAACTPGGVYCAGNTVCTGPEGGSTRCEQPCTTNAECVNGSTCEQGQGGHKYCARPYTPPVVLSYARLERQTLASSCAAVGGGPLAGLLFALGGLLNRRHKRGVSR